MKCKKCGGAGPFHKKSVAGKRKEICATCTNEKQKQRKAEKKKDYELYKMIG